MSSHIVFSAKHSRSGPSLSMKEVPGLSLNFLCCNRRMNLVARWSLLLFLAMAVLGQAPAEDVRQTYAKLCSGCHGADARGSQQGPGLSGNLRLRKRSVQSLRNVIVRGVPAAGMPGFDLPAATLDGLVSLVVSLNASASESKVPGDVKAGSEFFFGKGQCSNCHMVSGRGAAVGPDLSSVATELTTHRASAKLKTAPSPFCTVAAAGTMSRKLPWASASPMPSPARASGNLSRVTALNKPPPGKPSTSCTGTLNSPIGSASTLKNHTSSLTPYPANCSAPSR